MSGQCDDTTIPSGSLVWEIEPIAVALARAGERRGGGAEPLDFEVCTEVGRRLLLAQFEFSSWVLRRVEKVRFASDRRIARSSTIEFRVPEHAPVVIGDDGEPLWLVPLSVMRRRTLVNLDLRDEENHGISLLGLRFTQELDAGLLRAAARLVHTAESHEAVDDFISVVISGTWEQVKEARTRYQSWRAAPKDVRALEPLAPYFAKRVFRTALERLWHNFTLYVTLPVSRGRHRLLRLAFEEKVEWRYQMPKLERDDKAGAYDYQPIKKQLGLTKSFYQFLGWQPTRIRFLTPSAENCASYHFEFTAPTGLWVTSAALVAGRPNVEKPGTAPWDSVSGTGHSAGLHAVEIPNGSLCRAQVDLRVPSRGWLSTLAVSCWAVAIVLAGAAWHARLIGSDRQWSTDQVTNIVLLLVTVSAGVATYVAQHPSGDVASRMLSGVRSLGVLSLTLPAVAAMSLVFLRSQPESTDEVRHPAWLFDRLPAVRTQDLVEGWLWTLTAVAVVATVMVTLAWVLALTAEHRAKRDSPWDMTHVDDDVDPERAPIDGEHLSFHQLLHTLHLDRPAIGVNSAEGWHERYRWTDGSQDDALRVLRRVTAEDGSTSTGCRCRRVREHLPQAENDRTPGR